MPIKIYDAFAHMVHEGFASPPFLKVREKIYGKGLALTAGDILCPVCAAGKFYAELNLENLVKQIDDTAKITRPLENYVIVNLKL